MVTLILETSTPRGAVALFDGETLAFSRAFTADRSHSSGLFAVIEEALAAGPAPGRIVAGLGPGSYAGVRIAIAAGIGLSVATGAEMLGIPSILGLADGHYLVLGDARRGGFWIAEIDNGALLHDPEIVTPGQLEARRLAATCPTCSSEPLPGTEARFPDAIRLGRLALAGHSLTDKVEPLYLREPHITVPKRLSHETDATRRGESGEE